MNCIYCEKWGVSRHAVVCDDALGAFCQEKCGWNPETPRGSVCMEIRVKQAGGALPKHVAMYEEDEDERTNPAARD